MPRTTICRSKLVAPLALAAALLGAPGLAAQDTTRADTARAAELGQPLAQLPATHVVVTGESLWAIALLYYGDPLLWPEIYRLNTAVIEDPHWIYPGEELVLAPSLTVAQGPTADTVTALPQAADTVRADTVGELVDTTQLIEAPPPEPTETYSTIFERNRSRSDEIRRLLSGYANQPYRPLRRWEFYAAGFLTEEEKFPWADVLGKTEPPAIHRLSERSTAGRFEEIAIRPPNDASYHVGDSLLLARVDRDQAGWGAVVVPVGVARVTEVQDDQILAEVIMLFSRVRAGQVALPLEPFKDPGEVRPTPVTQGLEGRLVAQRDVHPIVSAQQFLFIDKGRRDGVVPGDVFEVYLPPVGEPGTPSEDVRSTLLIVHTRERSATAMIIGVRHPDVRAGMRVRLIKKMPS